MHALTRMARPTDKEVPMSYYDFMTKDSVSTFIICAITLLCLVIFVFIVIVVVLYLWVVLSPFIHYMCVLPGSFHSQLHSRLCHVLGLYSHVDSCSFHATTNEIW